MCAYFPHDRSRETSTILDLPDHRGSTIPPTGDQRTEPGINLYQVDVLMSLHLSDPVVLSPRPDGAICTTIPEAFCSEDRLGWMFHGIFIPKENQREHSLAFRKKHYIHERTCSALFLCIVTSANVNGFTRTRFATSVPRPIGNGFHMRKTELASGPAEMLMSATARLAAVGPF